MVVETAEKAVVRCDGCGEIIYEGWFNEEMVYSGQALLGIGTDRDHHYCDMCHGNPAHEFRTCSECGRPMDAGFTVEGGGWYCCKDCFEPMMSRDYSGWRENSHADDRGWDGGYYDAIEDEYDGIWRDTGIYYTEWF